LFKYLYRLRSFEIYIFIFVFCYLLAGWALFFQVDCQNVKGLRSTFAANFEEFGFVFLYLYSEHGLTEILQWSFLLGIVVVFAKLAHFYKQKTSVTLMRTCMLCALAFALLLMEDVGSIRHELTYWVEGLFYPDHPTRLFYRSIVESFYYLLLAIFPLVAFFRIMSGFQPDKITIYLLTAGYILYGVAGFMSSTRFIGDWYELVGYRLVVICGLEEGLRHATSPSIGFWVMDALVEESIELIASALIFVSSIRLRRKLRTG